MTRINLGIDPSRLSTKHLVAEHREIKRIPNVIKSGKYSMQGKPDKFCLGSGHVKFFYDKIGYLHKRYNEILQECRNRGFNMTDYNEAFEGVPTEMLGDYEPTLEDIILIEARIKERDPEFKLSNYESF